MTTSVVFRSSTKYKLVAYTWPQTLLSCAQRAYEHCLSIEGWIHSKRRNKIHQTLVEKLVHSHTNLLLRESLDDSISSITVWHRAYHRWSRWWARGGTRRLSVHYFSSYLICLLKVETHTWSQRTCIKHLFLVMLTTLLDWTGLNTKKTLMACTSREKETDWDTFFFEKKSGKK
jgi:hypothetical protein